MAIRTQADVYKRFAAERVMSHVDFTKLIAEEGAKLGELHAQVRRTFLHQVDSKSHVEWEHACYEFRSYVSPMEPYIERARKKVRYSDGNLLEFVVCFVSIPRQSRGL